MNLGELHRHQYGLLVTSLTKRLGVSRIDLIEDAVQYAMEQALLKWNREAKPENQLGWLFRVAYRHVVNEIRGQTRKKSLLDLRNLEEKSECLPEEIPFDSELTDSFLKMLFIACDETIPVESQLVFILKSLCGFNTTALATRLFTSESNVYKRFQRAKRLLKHRYSTFDSLTDVRLQQRLPDVLKVVYLMFTEGYLSSHPDNSIRQDLSEEALRIMQIIINNDVGNHPQCHALIALIYFNLARLTSRKDESGLILLDMQDRTLWDTDGIRQGMYYLDLSAQGPEITRYHIEAGIAAEHCMAPSFSETNWNKIVSSYDLLQKISPSPMHQLNQAIAISEAQSPQAALHELKTSHPPNWLVCSYYWYAVLADLEYQCKNVEQGNFNAQKALALSNSEHISLLLQKRFNRYVE